MRNIIKLLPLSLLILLAACGKKYLDVKPEANLVVPVKLDDFQAMLDYTTTMNESSPVNIGMIGADDYYVTAAQYSTAGATGAPDFQKNAYIWADQVYIGRETAAVDWNNGYSHILITNYAIEGTDKIQRTPVNGAQWDNVRGSAFFFRAYNFYLLAQLYCPVYNASTAGSDLGLSLRMESDPSVRVPRASVQATYQQIIKDLTDAETMLPDMPEAIVRPGKAAVYALFSRIYLQMGDYAKSKNYADKCLQLQNDLIDFNTLSFTTANTFPANGKGNAEVILLDNAASVTMNNNFFNADTTLLKSYAAGDLRYKAYYLVNATTKRVTFKGSYKGNTSYFAGLATDEIYLNRAECLARLNEPAAALDDLNKLRQSRFTPDTYAALESTDAQQVLDWVIAERRIELVMRGTRWPDLRRLNKETRYSTTLKRVLEGVTYELNPGNTHKWTWPLPVEAVENGGLTQNPR